MKQAMYTNFRTSVESELKQLPEKLSLREFTRFILRLAREILSSESTYLSNQPKPIGDDIKKMIIAITRENKAELANRGYDTNSVKSLKVTRFLVEQYIIEITGIDQSSVLADLVIQKLVDAGKKFKRIPSPTSDGIIDQNYLAELFAGTNLPELKAFYEEYFREISTYELMKKLPADELKDTITNLYARRNLGSNAPAHMTQSTVTASALPAPPSSPVQEPIATSSALPSQPSSKKKKKKTGSGLGGDDNDEEPRSNVYILFNKYKIDKRKLDAGVLEIRYIANRHLIPIKPRHVSIAFRKFLLDFLQTRQFDASAHFELNKEEKFLFNSIAKYIGFDLDQLDTDDSFAKRWDVIMGELNAGNDSKDLKREARQYIILAQNMGMLTRDNANGIIWQYNL
jgi:hypothetical protein